MNMTFMKSRSFDRLFFCELIQSGWIRFCHMREDADPEQAGFATVYGNIRQKTDVVTGHFTRYFDKKSGGVVKIL